MRVVGPEGQTTLGEGVKKNNAKIMSAGCLGFLLRPWKRTLQVGDWTFKLLQAQGESPQHVGCSTTLTRGAAVGFLGKGMT